MNLRFIPLCFALLYSSCSPLRSSPSDGQHLFELSLHEVRTHLDDLRHDINCFQTELQILEGRIKSHEQTLASLRENDLEKYQIKLEQLHKQIQSFEKNGTSHEKGQSSITQELKQLSTHANETTAALIQFKARILEIEQELSAQNRRFAEVAKTKGSLEHLKTGSIKVYIVKPGDTLEKIARLHETTVEKIKKCNDLEKDFIAIGQQLKMP